MKGIQTLERLSGKLMAFLAIICGLVMAFNMVIIICDVFMRYVFSAPIQGATELVAIMMAYIGYFGLGYTLKNGKHIAMSALYEKNKGRYKYVADVIIYAVIIVAMIALCYATFDLFASSFARMEKANSTTTIYVWIGKGGSFIGCVGMLIQSVVMFLSSLLKAIHYPNVGVGGPSEQLDTNE